MKPKSVSFQLCLLDEVPNQKTYNTNQHDKQHWDATSIAFVDFFSYQLLQNGNNSKKLYLQVIIHVSSKYSCFMGH